MPCSRSTSISCTPNSAAAFSGWVFDSWVNYDTHRASDEEANAYAEANADSRFQSVETLVQGIHPRIGFRRSAPREDVGLSELGRARPRASLRLHRARPRKRRPRRVSGYLKNHGSRTSQASALLEVLAGKGDPISLQVVIAAATRAETEGACRPSRANWCKASPTG